MKCLKSHQLRTLYLDFFKSKGHNIIPSASLIPENDPSVLFTAAGMHPLIPYLEGLKHPEGTRLVNVQKVVRTGNIENVGDASYCTFFELLGNWSMGDYFKREAIAYSWEFLTNEQYLGINNNKLYFTCFEGNSDAPKDIDSHQCWLDLGVSPSHIFYLKKNWKGPYGKVGLCGPNTRIFYDTGNPSCGFDCKPSCSCAKYLEIWDNVFLEYSNQGDRKLKPLAQKSVDTGMGIERVIAILQKAESIYDTDIFEDIIAYISKLSNKNYKESPQVTRAFRIVADHVRCATFIMGDARGATPSNVGQGYVLRRIIRRAIRFAMQIGMPENSLSQVAAVVLEKYGNYYVELPENRTLILDELSREERRFQQTLKKGLQEFIKIKLNYRSGDIIDGVTAFRLYNAFGFPFEFTKELAEESGLQVDCAGYRAAFLAHQINSRKATQQRFKIEHTDKCVQITKLHTVTHILYAALRRVIGENVRQRGNNITVERLRFDFSFHRKMTEEELGQVEAFVNAAINENLQVTYEIISREEAKQNGTFGLHDGQHSNWVKVYTIGNISKEICSGPHEVTTSGLGTFKIIKEEASSTGVRRIKAILKL